MSPTSNEILHVHAERIRASGILGRSQLMQRLFDFLVDCAQAERTPKEIEIALEVFGKRPDFDVGQDAMVRVYMVKLRRKLDEFYALHGASDPERLILPKGEYRLVFRDRSELLAQPVETEEPSAAEAEEAEVELESLVASKAASAQVRPWKAWLLASGVTTLLLLMVLMPMVWRFTNLGESLHLRPVRNNPVWAEMFNDDLPVYVVIGDYYIFGELNDTSMDVQRLVREFNINSALDLEQYLKNNPELADRYADLSLKYLPVSAAFALHGVLPLLQSGGKDPRKIQIVLASDLTPAMAQSAHVVYIGLLSGMGILQKLVFDGSQLAIGDSYDELIDRQSRKKYISFQSLIDDARSARTDYGYVASRTGIEGNRIVVIAGTRDVAMQYMAEVMTRQPSLDSLEKQAGTNKDFEALYSVRGLEQASLGGDLVLTHRFASRWMQMPSEKGFVQDTGESTGQSKSQ